MDEKELVCRAKFGDKEALNKIVDMYYDDIYKFLYRRMGNKAAAEDVTQDTFIKFIKNLPYYKEKNKLKSFLFTIAINSSNDFFRRHKQETSLLSLDNVGDEITEEGTEDEILQKEEALIVRKAILSLPDVNLLLKNPPLFLANHNYSEACVFHSQDSFFQSLDYQD